MRPEIGCVTHGTGHPEDSLPLLAEALETLDENKIYSSVLEDTNAYLDELYASVVDDEEDQKPYDLLDSLSEALNELAPNYAYFGEQETGYEEYGFWVNWEYLKEEIASGDVLQSASFKDVPENHTGFILIADNFNTEDIQYTLYSRADKGDIWIEEWSVTSIGDLLDR